MGRGKSRVDFGGWNKSKMRSCFRLCTAGCPTGALRYPQVRQPAVLLARLRARASRGRPLHNLRAERRPQPHIPGSVGRRSRVTSLRESNACSLSLMLCIGAAPPSTFYKCHNHDCHHH
jgi:hypothetical protein